MTENMNVKRKIFEKSSLNFTFGQENCCKSDFARLEFGLAKP